MPNILPCQLNTPNPMLGRLFLNRYLLAIWLCFLTEYQLLGVFVLYQRMNPTNPIDWLFELLNQIVFSFCTIARMQLVGIHLVVYSLLLCRLHEQFPTCHRWRLQRLQKELPVKLSLLVILISLGYWSSWVYLQYMVGQNVDVDVSYMGYYLLANGAFCGLVYFLTEHLLLGNEVWPLPLIRIESTTWQCLRWRHFDLRHNLSRSVLYTVGFAAFYWPNMSGNYLAGCQLLYLSSCITALITIKLHAIKRVFGAIMHQELPLTFQVQQEQGLSPLKPQYSQDRLLSMSSVLGEDNQLHGIKLQAARDFYMIASRPNGEVRNLFQLHGVLRKKALNWEALRCVLLGNIAQFTQSLNECLASPEENAKQTNTSCHPGMRRLGPPAVETKFWSRRCSSLDPPPPKPLFKSLLEQLKLQLQSCQLKCSRNCLPDEATQFLRSDKEDCELCVGRPLVWLIPGLVCISIRTLEEDRHGLLQQDLEMIFNTLTGLQKQIADLLAVLHLRKQNPCKTLNVLSQALTLSLNKLIYYFNMYNFILSDMQLPTL